MSFDLAVLAMNASADAEQARAMAARWSERSTPAIEAIQDLAAEHSLVLFDPQSEDAYLPGQ